MNNDAVLKIAPGMRIELRSVEWLVKRTLTMGMKLHLVEAIGLSEIVRDREMSFILEYEREGTVKIMDPADVTLVPDTSPRYIQTLLYLESLLRSAAPKDTKLSIGPRAAVDPMSYQLEPARKALQAPRPRILIADDVGLGKTIEAGILVSELIARGRDKRILVVTTKAMLTQFQKEFWVCFSIGLTCLDSLVLQRIKERLPERHNPFHYFDRTIVSIDTLKNNKRFGAALEGADWDIIVIDEAQNVAERRHGSGISQCARLAQMLRNRYLHENKQDETEHRFQWAGALCLFNLFQFLPRTYWLCSTETDPVDFPLVPSPVSGPRDNWDEAWRYLDEKAQPLALQLRQAGVRSRLGCGAAGYGGGPAGNGVADCPGRHPDGGPA